MSVRFFITNNFIKDCMNPDKTIYIFGGKFNSPIEGSTFTISVDGNIPITGSPNPFYSEPTDSSENGNLGDYYYDWYRVTEDGTSAAVNFSDLINGDILPCTIDKDRSKISVKIPYKSGLNNQKIGYLTYYTQADSEEDILVHETNNGQQSNNLPEIFKGFTERVALVFESGLNNIGLVRSSENPNDSNSYIDIDISKLNIAANILPVRYRVEGQGNIYYWGKYEDEHLHNLVNTTSTEKSGFDTENGTTDSITKSMIDVKSLKDNTMNQALAGSNTYKRNIIKLMIPEDILDTSEDCMLGSLIISNDGRYINSESNATNTSTKLPITVDRLKGSLLINKYLLADPEGQLNPELNPDIFLKTDGILLVSGFNAVDGGDPEVLNKFDTEVLISNTEETIKYRLSTLNPYDSITI